MGWCTSKHFKGRAECPRGAVMRASSVQRQIWWPCCVWTWSLSHCLSGSFTFPTVLCFFFSSLIMCMISHLLPLISLCILAGCKCSCFKHFFSIVDFAVLIPPCFAGSDQVRLWAVSQLPVTPTSTNTPHPHSSTPHTLGAISLRTTGEHVMSCRTSSQSPV